MPITKEQQDAVDKMQKEMLDNQKEKAAKDPNKFNDPAPKMTPTAK